MPQSRRLVDERVSRGAVPVLETPERGGVHASGVERVETLGPRTPVIVPPCEYFTEWQQV